MKKQIAIALTAALLAFPVAPVLADTTSTETTSVNTTSTQTPSTQAGDTSTVNNGETTTPTDGTTTTNAGNDVTATSTGSVTEENATDATTDATVEDENGNVVDPGVLPDSPLYWFQTLIEKVKVALNFDPVKKAAVVEQQATENLAEAQALVKEGKLDEAEKTLTTYSDKVEQAQAFLDQLEDPNSQAAQDVQAALTKVNTHNIVVLSGLLEKLPPQAAQKIALNIVRSMEKAVAKAEKMASNSDASATETSTVDQGTTVNDSTQTDNQAELKDQAKKALEDFQVGLGLKKAKNTPNGNAYGYYKNKDQEVEQNSENKEDQNKESNVIKEQVKTQINTSTVHSDDQNDEDNNDHGQQVHTEKGGKADKAAKEKGNRD